jgi:hypothetical protein
MARRRSVVLAAGLVCALLAINAYLCSPWHQHYRLSLQVCSFSQFDHGGGLEPPGQVRIEPPAVCACSEPDSRAPRSLPSYRAHWFGRAPPA